MIKEYRKIINLTDNILQCLNRIRVFFGKIEMEYINEDIHEFVVMVEHLNIFYDNLETFEHMLESSVTFVNCNCSLMLSTVYIPY